MFGEKINSLNFLVFRPCILIFDSLAGASRSRVVATLRDYLTCEYQAKVSPAKVFNKDNIKGSCPKIPQQNNFTDCGLYLLQYVEQFFKVSIKYNTISCYYVISGVQLGQFDEAMLSYYIFMPWYSPSVDRPLIYVAFFNNVRVISLMLSIFYRILSWTTQYPSSN